MPDYSPHDPLDAPGFTASRYARWVDHKYGQQKQKEWVKVHLMCGVKTNIVTAVVIGDKNANDSPMLPALVETTSENFSPQEISADKAYGSFRNYDAISEAGATPYIPFKENRNENTKPRTHLKSELWGFKIRDEKKTKNALWNKMYHYFRFQQDDFMEHYHKRSNVETVFSMIKGKFGGNVRSKTDVAMVNECLCKIICHNICVLIQEIHELGIDVTFKLGVH
jgi:Transposase DDE domain